MIKAQHENVFLEDPQYLLIFKITLKNQYVHNQYDLWLQELDPQAEKPSADSYHANGGQLDQDGWLEPLTESSETRRPKLSFTDT